MRYEGRIRMKAVSDVSETRLLHDQLAPAAMVVLEFLRYICTRHLLTAILVANTRSGKAESAVDQFELTKISCFFALCA
jgi:hypothetical protein